RSVWSRTKSRISRTDAVPSLRLVWMWRSALPNRRDLRYGGLLGPSLHLPQWFHHVPLLWIGADPIFEDSDEGTNGLVHGSRPVPDPDGLGADGSIAVAGIS